jgi:peptide/nickel transport system permease protein
MGRFVLTRLVRAVLTVLGVSTLVFVLVRASGDPVRLFLPENASAEEAQQFRQQLGLADPLPLQYVRFLGDLTRGDLGISLRQRAPALGLVQERLPASLQLAGSAFLLSLLIAVPLGIWVGIHPRTRLAAAILGLAFARQSIPVFWFGQLLILLFAVWLGWLPPFGTGSWQHLVMPALALATLDTALYIRLLGSGLSEALRSEYVRTARAKGLAERAIGLRHALRNAALPFVTMAGLNLGLLLSGAVATETVFAWPGVGRLAVQAVGQRDYPVVQAVVLLVSLLFVAVNLLVDVLYGYLDPRIRLS